MASKDRTEIFSFQYNAKRGAMVMLFEGAEVDAMPVPMDDVTMDWERNRRLASAAFQLMSAFNPDFF